MEVLSEVPPGTPAVGTPRALRFTQRDRSPVVWVLPQVYPIEGVDHVWRSYPPGSHCPEFASAARSFSDHLPASSGSSRGTSPPVESVQWSLTHPTR